MNMDCLGKIQDKNKAFKIYKDGADLKNDYLCMYRLYMIYFNDYENFKLEKRINTLLYVKQKYSGSAKELENIAEEIEEIGKKIKDLNNETSEYKKLYLDEEKNISQYKKEIGLTNKSIYDLKKEIDSIVPGINYLIKHSNEIKNKISTQEHLNSIFFLNMLNMIEKVNSH